MNQGGFPTPAILLVGVAGFLCLGFEIWYGVFFLRRQQPRFVRYLERKFDVTIDVSWVGFGFTTVSGGSALTTLRVWLRLGLFAVVEFAGAMIPLVLLWWATRHVKL